MPKFKIRHAGFVYHKEHSVVGTDGKATKIWTPVMAYRNDEVEIAKQEDIDLGKREGAFWTKDYYPPGHRYEGAPKGFTLGQQFNDEDSEVPVVDDVPDFENESDEEVAAWVADHNEAEIVAAATTPDIAAILAQAEENASGRDPRKGVMAKLEKIVDQA